jgi:hypothetical protein
MHRRRSAGESRSLVFIGKDRGRAATPSVKLGNFIVRY